VPAQISAAIHPMPVQPRKKFSVQVAPRCVVWSLNRDYNRFGAGTAGSVRAVKAKLNRLISELPKTGSIVITKNGRACAPLMPITEDTDLEALALAQNKRFWRLFDAAYERAEKEGWVELEELA
jgi:antitoxin (DNA-binding transcriptional repressor) of toxin-antitoxin stability system